VTTIMPSKLGTSGTANR